LDLLYSNLEGQLQKQIDSYEVVDMDLVSGNKGDISVGWAGDFSPNCFFVQITNPEQITTDIPKKYSSRTDITYPSVFNSNPHYKVNQLFFSTPVTVNVQSQPDVIWPEPGEILNPTLSWKTQDSSYPKIPSQPDATKPWRPDGIPSRLLLKLADEIAPLLSKLLNMSLLLGIVPSKWKLANITPVFKADDPTLSSNYWPISLLFILSKVILSCSTPPYIQRIRNKNWEKFYIQLKTY
jgi:hypothetical protein